MSRKPPPVPPRSVASITYTSRAAFGLGFIVLGAIALYRVLTTAAPVNSKLIGGALGVVMIGLGIFRIVQYLRWRRAGGT
jgi:cadmium resistance protein CadD (predicted permease)